MMITERCDTVTFEMAFSHTELLFCFRFFSLFVSSFCSSYNVRGGMEYKYYKYQGFIKLKTRYVVICEIHNLNKYIMRRLSPTPICSLTTALLSLRRSLLFHPLLRCSVLIWIFFCSLFQTDWSSFSHTDPFLSTPTSYSSTVKGNPLDESSECHAIETPCTHVNEECHLSSCTNPSYALRNNNERHMPYISVIAIRSMACQALRYPIRHRTSHTLAHIPSYEYNAIQHLYCVSLNNCGRNVPVASYFFV